ncbi:hypothetical protein GJR96_10470 [Haloferax sp. MBLA0076]|uniref:DUF8100 domain-containing protein n=1 Tax=Haloferax litoreum TaxID=2666140 RepID=A0A6A8GL53_9EURY|nr:MULTISPECIES: hypothetical protein [Haloferax]KAB1193836.1 hypothetical protein Hfx1148_10430 [Haloferax sp. CBA1148]MRX22380.1 hypothetical protein [Haloferax litoreum]
MDYTQTRTFVLGLALVGVVAVEFGLVFVLAKSLQIMTLATLDARPDSIIAALLLGLVPGVVLGAVVPFLFQYFVYFNRLSSKPAVRASVMSLTVGTYAALFFYHPVTAVIYAFVYLASRVTTLTGIYGGSRITSALA